LKTARGHRTSPSFGKARFDVAKTFVEAAKELAAVPIQHLPNIWIVEVVGVPVQKTALRRLCIYEVRNYRREHDRVWSRHATSGLYSPGLVKYVGVERDYVRSFEYPLDRPAQPVALTFRTSVQDIGEFIEITRQLAVCPRSRELAKLWPQIVFQPGSAFFLFSSVPCGSESENAGIIN
jgi:hypothetical protein